MQYDYLTVHQVQESFLQEQWFLTFFYRDTHPDFEIPSHTTRSSALKKSEYEHR